MERTGSMGGSVARVGGTQSRLDHFLFPHSVPIYNLLLFIAKKIARKFPRACRPSRRYRPNAARQRRWRGKRGDAKDEGEVLSVHRALLRRKAPNVPNSPDSSNNPLAGKGTLVTVKEMS